MMTKVKKMAFGGTAQPTMLGRNARIAAARAGKPAPQTGGPLPRPQTSPANPGAGKPKMALDGAPQTGGPLPRPYTQMPAPQTGGPMPRPRIQEPQVKVGQTGPQTGGPMPLPGGIKPTLGSTPQTGGGMPMPGGVKPMPVGVKPGTTDVRPPMPSGPIQTQKLAPGATAPAPGPNPMLMKKGGSVKAKKMASGGVAKVSSASKRGDGCAQRGKTRGKLV